MATAADRHSDPADGRTAGELAAAAAELRVTVSRLLRQLRATYSGLEVTPSQSVALSRLLTDGPATVAALARAENVRPQSMRLTVAALAERGLVERAPHPTDQRQVLLRPTAAAERLITAARTAKEDWLAQALAAKLSRAEQDSLLAAIPLLRRLLDD
ncbi:MarR family winged helix-turn-helix transcriptional regulator [Nocardia blacklockiae]|uniref:MarR family winged helix-turn-helix transcriptional regulator n=1 Tax=Nocardia blacklockiae TaxID=480036 RepID=UPI001893EFB0|nr:MarR family transcriptional regulator [Nocardia blacklockiae]MBF6176765.1 MarR family transcriptional regulator [Nocardia blacklockiae]